MMPSLSTEIGIILSVLKLKIFLTSGYPGFSIPTTVFSLTRRLARI